jgi:hypothetical protein
MWHMNGRPPIPPDRRRSRTLRVRLTNVEYAALARKADTGRTTVSEMARRLLLGHNSPEPLLVIPETVEAPVATEAELGMLVLPEGVTPASKIAHRHRFTKTDDIVRYDMGSAVYLLRCSCGLTKEQD